MEISSFTELYKTVSKNISLGIIIPFRSSKLVIAILHFVKKDLI